MHTLDTMSHFLLSMEMIIVGRAIGVGRDKGDVEKDEEGMLLVNALGGKSLLSQVVRYPWVPDHVEHELPDTVMVLVVHF